MIDVCKFLRKYVVAFESHLSLSSLDSCSGSYKLSVMSQDRGGRAPCQSVRPSKMRPLRVLQCLLNSRAPKMGAMRPGRGTDSLAVIWGSC